ncbi:hypothetical protein FA13DRAFT_1715472 [Coprinellus micaceus]|uniref:Uncharacterized protein n=1 Tax=Coprinellus micaceus TaxID=71717 RepID=A0A4Y7SMX6_COPMI|nr:hypothetical protein FA13DRAFT_1715472 [Coprinellus micaceus]
MSRVSAVMTKVRAWPKGVQAAMAPPNLPAEILSNIFLMLAWSHRVEVPQYGTGKAGSWICVTHVCQHWRNAALDCASLWTHLIFSKPGLPEFMLLNSKNLPLTIELNSFNEDLGPFVDTLCEATSHIYRLRSLCVGAPILERVILSRRVEWHSEDLQEVIPEGFLSGETPSLRHLDLTHCTIQKWDALPLAAGLTFLQLHSDPHHPSTRPGPATFFNYICTMASLETLSLSEMLPGQKSTLANRFKIPSGVRQMSLTDNIEFSNMFFRAADVAKATKLRITFLNSEDGEPLVDFVDLLEILWNPTIRSTLYGVEFLSGDGSPDRLAFSFTRSKIILDHDLIVTLKIRTRTIEHNPPPRLNLNQAPSILYQELDFTTLIALKVQQESPWDTNMWALMFGELPSLVLLAFQDNIATLGLLAALQQILADTQSPSPIDLFPRLTIVAAQDVDFDKQLSRVYDREKDIHANSQTEDGFEAGWMSGGE